MTLIYINSKNLTNYTLCKIGDSLNCILHLTRFENGSGVNYRVRECSEKPTTKWNFARTCSGKPDQEFLRRGTPKKSPTCKIKYRINRLF